MSKPEASKKESPEKQAASESTEKGEKTPPSTAKQLLVNFDPEDSDQEDTNLEDEDNEPVPKKQKDGTSKKYTPKYRKEWEKKPELKAWLSESIHGNTYFYCKFCKKDYRCGFSDIHKHMSSKKHTLKAAMPDFKAQKFKFRGLLCPVFTPFTHAKKISPEVNLKAINKYANFLAACGIKGILINDVLGEGMALTIRERMDLTDAWADTCHKTNQFLMVQIGGAPLKDVVEMAKHCSNREVGAVVLLPDLYNKPKNHLDLIRYIKIISDFTQNVPILYHHHSKFTNIEFDVVSFLLDITGEVDTFVGVIYTTNDIQKSTSAMAVNREKFTVFMGTDEVLHLLGSPNAILAAVANGFTCIMGNSINFLPKLVQSICDSVRSGDIKSAQTSQNLLRRTIDAVSKEGDYVSALKVATDVLTGTCGTNTREPLQSLWEGTIKKIQLELKELGLV